ncbi:hypothetical protein [Paraburkholderia caribensis]|uniref:hypothetical protein n=1 Tax=Paraburkholderia caribensis TaxID=75105 RepID=UPI003F658D76
MIIWIRRRMAEFNITPDALKASIQRDLDHPPLYRDARGNEWNGIGDVPNWLKAAKHAGVSEEFFRIESKSEPAAVMPRERNLELGSEVRHQSPGADPRQLDLFT